MKAVSKILWKFDNPALFEEEKHISWQRLSDYEGFIVYSGQIIDNVW